MISIATMGKYWPQAGYGLGWNTVKGIGGEGGGYMEEVKRKPVVVIDAVREKDIKIEVEVLEITDD